MTDVQRLYVTGEPGSAMGLYADDTLIRSEYPTTRAVGWDFDSFGWFAARAAEQLGVDWLDERDEAAWRAWEADPEVRARVAFEKRLKRSRTRNPQLHEAEPTPITGRDVRADLDAVTMVLGRTSTGRRRITLDRTTLHMNGQAIPLAAITRTEVLFAHWSSPEGAYLSGRLAVQVGHQFLFSPSIQIGFNTRLPGELKWVAEQVLEAAEKARATSTDRGDEADIPEELAVLRAYRQAQAAQAVS